MARLCIFVVLTLFVCGSQCVFNMCTFLPPDKEVDWRRLKRGPWKWAMNTHDPIQDMLQCSDVLIDGEGQGSNQNFTIEYQNKLGGLYYISGNRKSKGEYHITEFKIEIERKGNVMFYTNYKNYFITATCMPDGRVSVAAFTRHRRVRRKLLNLIYSVLTKHKVLAIGSPSYCEQYPTFKKSRA